MHEASLHSQNQFITLTYDEAHYAPSLNYKDFQLFANRVRRKYGPFRYFAAGEYGALNGRPHFHALVFGLRFPPRTQEPMRWSTSPALENLWPAGYSSVAELTYQTAFYVAQYAVKKVLGPRAPDHYQRVHLKTGEIVPIEPEMAHMSTNPGIGYHWLMANIADVYGPRDGVVVHGGHTLPSPRYYDNLLARVAPHMTEEIEFDRSKNRRSTTPLQRLSAELNARAKLSKRKI